VTALANRPEQRTSALAEANRVRLGRAALLKPLAFSSTPESCRRAADLIEDTPELLASLTVGKFLDHVHRVGQSTVERIVEACGVFEGKPLGEITPRQRAALAAALRYRAGEADANRAARRHGNRCQDCGALIPAANEAGVCGFCAEQDGRP